MSKVYFVLPAYNEEENIKDVVGQWHPVVERIDRSGTEARLVIANDGSKDNTFRIMQELQAAYPLLVPLDKPNGGHGATVLYLYRYALANGADWVFQTDSDGQTDPEEFSQMWEHREEYDFQIGYRKGRQDGARADKLQAIMDVIPPDYFLCNVAISAIAVKWKYRIGWYRITFRPRQGGVNSINMKRIFKIGWKALGDFRKINRNLKTVR